MKFHLRGIHVPHKKNTANMMPSKMPAPATVTLSCAMHIGKPATPVVKVGDKVCVGTLVAKGEGAISSNIHASVSGTVSKIGEIMQVSGKTVPAIVITSDGQMTPDPAICPPTITTHEELISALEASGIVGLGGAGFPTYAKFRVDDPAKIKDLIVNGAECEPYITSDSVTMVTRAKEIGHAIEVLDSFFHFERILIGIEKNKPEAIAKMQSLSEENDRIQVVVLPATYPQGGEKVLVYQTTGKVIPDGKLPLDVGCVVSNCSTLAAMGDYFLTGMPLVERCITVDGSSVKTPQNVIVPIGTSISDVFAYCDWFSEEPRKVLYGGPMMGVAVPGMDAPILKNTNAILAFGKKEAAMRKPWTCISCGNCINACPLGVNPPAIARALKTNDVDAMRAAGATICMECGCCSYVCPAYRPLVQNHKLAKAAIRAAAQKK